MDKEASEGFEARRERTWNKVFSTRQIGFVIFLLSRLPNPIYPLPLLPKRGVFEGQKGTPKVI
jgi:hypothetical protein